MIDKYQNFLQLQHNERDLFHIQTSFQAQALVILAIHAGGIEMGTSELAEAIAGNDFSLYLFEGFAPNGLVLHITSTNFDEPRCLELVKKHDSSLSLHGFSRTQSDPQIYLGGTDLPLVHQLLEALNQNGFRTEINSGKYAALDPANICNRTISGKGVQMELSGELRSHFFADYLHRKGREIRTPEFDRFVQVVRVVLLAPVLPSSRTAYGMTPSLKSDPVDLGEA